MNPIKKMRIEKGWSQQHIANKIGSTQQQVSRWENSPEMLRLRRRSLIMLSKAFNTNYDGMKRARLNMEVGR